MTGVPDTCLTAVVTGGLAGAGGSMWGRFDCATSGAGRQSSTAALTVLCPLAAMWLLLAAVWQH